jgi:phenylpropionate dioxygenase-like ring-hydroxylating dioxygenase large terminal subunit
MSSLSPPALPFGWFQVAYSDELSVGDVVALRYFDRELVLWRDQEGSAHLFDAYCPHLGAHLGHGGTVAGCALECPFHGWNFGADGTCTRVPYSDHVSPRARVRTYELDEHSGLILAWYHPLDKGSMWRVPAVTEHTDREFTAQLREQWRIRTTWYEIAENSVDVAHFARVHRTPVIPKCTYEEFEWSFRAMTVQTFTTPLGLIEGQIDSLSSGPGIGVVRFSAPVDLCLIPAITPVDASTIDVRFAFMVRELGDEALTARVQRSFVDEIRKQVTEDIEIWEHKQFLPRPVLSPDDGPIAGFRRWASRFRVDDAAA